MVKRTKKRTHTKVSEEELAKIPRSMVIRLGSALRNHSLSQLVKDFRYVMQPHTAINLRERKLNKLKDFVVMAGPLGVSELFIFNQSEETGNLSLRIGRLPRGPTLQFRIDTYSLMKDLRTILRHPKSVGRDSKEFLTPPLLVLNGFKLTEPSEKLMVTVFQNMFPPIQPQSTKVSGIKRVLMINKKGGQISMRHFSIDTKLVEESRNVKKLLNTHHNKKKIPNLGRNNDIADLLLDPYAVGLTSDSEVEEDAVVEIKEEIFTKKVIKEEVRKRAIKLTELGPRINMTLMKIEEGLTGSSKTIYHAVVNKSNEDVKKLEKKHSEFAKLKAERRAAQQENLKNKTKVKDEKKQRRKDKRAAGDGEHVEGDDGESGDSESDEDAPLITAEDYENDSDLFSDA